MTNTNSIYDTTYIIYMHTNTISGKSYIGKTVSGLEKRWKQHLSTTKNTSLNSHFHKAIRKYRIDSWNHEILFVSFKKDDDYLYEIEEELIKRYDTIDNGYNILVGGRGVGSGKNHPWFDRKHSDETKQRMSEAQKGEKNCFHNRKHSDEAKHKISKAVSGENHPRYGKTHSDEAKYKMSNSKKGENSPRFKGYYITPWGSFPSSTGAETKLCGNDAIQRWCLNNTKTINKISLRQSKYLKSLPENPVGKTFAELGFGFVKKQIRL